MRTNIVIDDALMAEAQRLSGLPTKRAIIEEALRKLIQLKRQEGIRQLRGQIQWDGNLDEMRRNRHADELIVVRELETPYGATDATAKPLPEA